MKYVHDHAQAQVQENGTGHGTNRSHHIITDITENTDSDRDKDNVDAIV